MLKYPVRCEIVDAEAGGGWKDHGMKTPEVSRPHIGKHGTARVIECEESIFGERVEITLDDGNIIYGDECWWVRIPPEE